MAYESVDYSEIGQGLIGFLLLLLIFGFRWALTFWRPWQPWKPWRQRFREYRAESWPTVEGLIVGGNVQRIPKSSRYLATLSYSYFAGGYEAGTYLRVFKREPEADDFVRQLRDRRVLVKYNERNPRKSVVENRTIDQLVALSPRFAKPS